MEEEPQGCRHPWEENKEKMPPLPVTGRREPTEEWGAYTQVPGSKGEASVLAEATSGSSQSAGWEQLLPPLGRGACPESEEQASQAQRMEKRGSQTGGWKVTKEDRDQCPPGDGQEHTKGENPPPPLTEGAGPTPKRGLTAKMPATTGVTSREEIQGGRSREGRAHRGGKEVPDGAASRPIHKGCTRPRGWASGGPRAARE